MPEPSIRRAVAAMKANRPLLAEEICRGHLGMAPGSIQHLALLGRALAKQGRYDEAAAQLDQAIALAPETPLLYEDLGSVREYQGRHEDAIELFEKAIRLDPRQPSAHRKLGEALAAAGRGEEADRHFESYFDRDPVAGRVAEGADHLRAGRLDEAMATFQDVLRKHPDNVDAMRYLGIAYWREKQKPGDAEAWFAPRDLGRAGLHRGLDESRPGAARQRQAERFHRSVPPSRRTRSRQRRSVGRCRQRLCPGRAARVQRQGLCEIAGAESPRRRGPT